MYTQCMTSESTTIRVSLYQRDRLKALALSRESTMTDTLDAALEALRREEFYRGMALAEVALRADPAAWGEYVVERDQWLEPDLARDS
jgi:hypothetical protein